MAMARRGPKGAALSLLPTSFDVPVLYSGRTTIKDLLSRGDFDYFKDGEFYTGTKGILDLMDVCPEWYDYEGIDDRRYPQLFPHSRLYKSGTETIRMHICQLAPGGFASYKGVISKAPKQPSLRPANAAELLAFALAYPEEAQLGIVQVGQIYQDVLSNLTTNSYALRVHKGKNCTLNISRRFIASKASGKEEHLNLFGEGTRFAMVDNRR